MCVLDTSALIWDEADFKNNRNHYYRLVDSISMFITKLNNEITPILMRNELRNEIFTNFPYEHIPGELIDFQTQALLFLKNISPLEYPDYSSPNMISVPDQIKAHYNNTTKNEISYLLLKIHSDSTLQFVYFTFEYLWNGTDKLITKVNEIEKEHETIISDKENELDNFFTQFKPAFDHNPKHNKTPHKTREKWEQAQNKSEFISRLSCYNGRDNIRPQELLDSAYKSGACYYNYDDENDTFVVFRNTRRNIYHAYDEYDPERIPEEVRNKLHK